MTTARTFILDSDVFITAKNAYYAFDICPGFWKGLIHTHRLGAVRSIDRIRNELLAGRREEDLVQWVKKDVPAAFFLDSNSVDVSSAYAEVMLWVQRNSQYFDRATLALQLKEIGDSACMTITYLPATLPAVTLR
jgi:Domain of unknown function (DUF4411)